MPSQVVVACHQVKTPCKWLAKLAVAVIEGHCELLCFVTSEILSQCFLVPGGVHLQVVWVHHMGGIIESMLLFYGHEKPKLLAVCFVWARPQFRIFYLLALRSLAGGQECGDTG